MSVCEGLKTLYRVLRERERERVCVARERERERECLCVVEREREKERQREKERERERESVCERERERERYKYIYFDRGFPNLSIVCCSVAACCSVLQCVAVCCSVLQCVAAPCPDIDIYIRVSLSLYLRLEHYAVRAGHRNTLQHTATHCNKLQAAKVAHFVVAARDRTDKPINY